MKKSWIILFLWSFLGYSQINVDSLNVEGLEKYTPSVKKKLGGMLSALWELDETSRKGTFIIKEYNPNYVLPFVISSDINKQPFNENPHLGQPAYKEYQDFESKFQISLKSKIVQSTFFGLVDIWVGYTQKAYWQVYNQKLSRPFREMNYEPELIFVVPFDISYKDFTMKMFSISVNHQSNGKEQVLSRSWNRIFFSSVFEIDQFILSLNRFIRISEHNTEDENPNISKYIGKWSISLAYNAGGGHTFSFLTRTNFDFKSKYHSFEGNYVFPINGNLKGLIQFSTGYGESLIEYNHHRSSIGLGIVFLDL